jgi:hypothetical protein
LFRLLWEPHAILIGVECELMPGAELQAPERGRDNVNAWQWDSVEVFLCPDPARYRYAQFIISAKGDIADVLVDLDAGTGKYGTPAWNTEVRAVASETADRYVLEMRLGLGSLAAAGLTPGQIWTGNFCRFRPDCATWSPTYGGFHSPARFGQLQFVAQP